MNIITVINAKGGCGKSTIAMSLAAGLAKLGSRTLLIDMDPQAQVTQWLGAGDGLTTEGTPAGEVFEHLFFLEVDRSTEPQETLVNRAACYRDYYRRGGLAVRHGSSAEEFAHFPFRILFIFKNAERRNNMAERLLSLHPPILNQVWLTTFAEMTARPFDSIWMRPIDYRDVKGTFAASSQALNDTVYRRDVHRETLVEQHARKHRLIAVN